MYALVEVYIYNQDISPNVVYSGELALRSKVVSQHLTFLSTLHL